MFFSFPLIFPEEWQIEQNEKYFNNWDNEILRQINVWHIFLNRSGTQIQSHQRVMSENEKINS